MSGHFSKGRSSFSSYYKGRSPRVGQISRERAGAPDTSDGGEKKTATTSPAMQRALDAIEKKFAKTPEEMEKHHAERLKKLRAAGIWSEESLDELYGKGSLEKIISHHLDQAGVYNRLARGGMTKISRERDAAQSDYHDNRADRGYALQDIRDINQEKRTHAARLTKAKSDLSRAKRRLRSEESLDESLRLLQKYENEKTGKSAKVYRDREWDEHRVKFFTNGKHHTEADSFHSDAEDAHSTAKHWIKESVEPVNEISVRPLRVIEKAHEVAAEKIVSAHEGGPMPADRRAEAISHRDLAARARNLASVLKLHKRRMRYKWRKAADANVSEGHLLESTDEMRLGNFHYDRGDKHLARAAEHFEAGNKKQGNRSYSTAQFHYNMGLNAYVRHVRKGGDPSAVPHHPELEKRLNRDV